jgi:hypothetical protein
MAWNKKKTEEEEKPKWYPSNNDVAELKEKLKGYNQTRINGRLQTQFDQHCKTLGILYFDDFGERVISQPNDYKILSDIYWKLKGKEDADTEFRMRNNPEERLALVERIKSMGVKFRLV